MARWQLTEPHYLNVPGAQTEDRSKGGMKFNKLPAHTHIDPNNEQDWNYREMVGRDIVDGKVIVCHVGKGEPRDIEFVGPPTPGMLPIDDEAREISAQYAWTPTQGLDDVSQSESFAQQLVMRLTDEMTAVKSQVQQGPSNEGTAELLKSIAEMMKMQTQLLAALSGKAVPIAPEPEPNIPPEAKKFDVQGKGPNSINEARRLAAQVAREAELELEPEEADDLETLPTAPPPVAPRRASTSPLRR